MSRQANDRFALKRNSRLTWFFNCSNSRNLINLNEALRSPAVTSLHLHVIESVSVYPSTLRFVFFRPSSIVVLSPFLSPSSFISLFLHFAYSWLLCWVHWGRGEGGGGRLEWHNSCGTFYSVHFEACFSPVSRGVLRDRGNFYRQVVSHSAFAG